MCLLVINHPCSEPSLALCDKLWTKQLIVNRIEKDITAARNFEGESPKDLYCALAPSFQSGKKGGIGRPMLLIHNSGLGTPVPSVRKGHLGLDAGGLGGSSHEDSHKRRRTR